VIAVGDIGWCGSTAIPLTARLIERNEGQLLLSGDLAYMHGSLTDFQRCFEPFYGQFRNRWRPVPGNHEYDTPNAAGYFQFFGSAAGPGGRGYYSFRTGDWLVLMLDSNLPTNTGSMQFEFVRAELQSNSNPCAMAPSTVHLRAQWTECRPARFVGATPVISGGRCRQWA
jgi:hypothetical protein